MHDTTLSKRGKVGLDDVPKFHERFFPFILKKTKIKGEGDVADDHVNSVERCNFRKDFLVPAANNSVARDALNFITDDAKTIMRAVEASHRIVEHQKTSCPSDLL